jgi:hypothetical protein
MELEVLETTPSRKFFLLRRKDWRRQITFNSWLGSCGVGWLQGFSGTEKEFEGFTDKAVWLARMYQLLYQPGHLLYTLADYQLNNPFHKLLVEIGARQIDEFPNITHGSAMMHVFRVNIRNAVGRYCNKYGEPYTEPPKDESEVEPEITKPIDSGWMHLPKR